MALNWERMFRRYVADEVRTPHFVPVAKLTRTQANYEILYYAILVVTVFVVGGVVALSGKLPHGNQVGVPLYAFAIVWATVIFALSKNQMAAAFSATGPIALILYFLVFGFPSKLGLSDGSPTVSLFNAGLIFVMALWAFYNWRIVRIAAAYPDMIDPPNAPQPRKRRSQPDYFDQELDKK